MPQERLPKQALLAKQMGKDQLNNLKLDRSNKLRILDRTARTSPKRMLEMMKNREVWRLNLELLSPRNPHGKAGNEDRKTLLLLLLQENAKIQ